MCKTDRCPNPQGGTFQAYEEVGLFGREGYLHTVQVKVKYRKNVNDPGWIKRQFSGCAVEQAANYGASSINGIQINDHCKRCGDYVTCIANKTTNSEI